MLLTSVLQANGCTAPYIRPQPLPATSFDYLLLNHSKLYSLSIIK